ncbi:hypothetical protein [uncultured Ruegeria sp.]|uniref:hypothetical protein n=1 Tax=uncultured Ruegeria sp. TaxID=259304 RepID=UPI002610680A|nr:hypothetical protein [uncultured Ruegeria sp.]
MKTDAKREAKLRAMLDMLRRGENVQNRQLQTWLTAEEYARFEGDRREQIELRKDLKDKPEQILEYEKRLKRAIFTYSKADNFSGRGNHKAAQKLFYQADTEFERLAEFLSEIMAGDASLAHWFDRNVHFDATNTPHSSSENFPRVITSRSLENRGGGHLTGMKTKRQTKIDAVETALESMQHKDEDDAAKIARRMSVARKLRKLASD